MRLIQYNLSLIFVFFESVGGGVEVGVTAWMFLPVDYFPSSPALFLHQELLDFGRELFFVHLSDLSAHFLIE